MTTNHESGHSDFQIDHFITVKGNWTPYGRYKQVLRELSKRQRGIDDLECTREELLLDCEELEQQIDRLEPQGFERRRKMIELRRKHAALTETRKALTETKREQQRFAELAETLKAEVGELTDERRRVLDEEMWAVRLKAMCAIELACNGRISTGTATLLLSTPPEFRKPILADVKEAARVAQQSQGRDSGRLVQWVETYDA